MEGETKQNFNFCQACNKHFTGIEPYSQHIASEKHKKKVKLFSELGVNVNDISTVTSSQGVAAPKVAFDMMANNFHCNVCNKDILGNDQYQAHLRGQPHAKKLKTLEMLKEFAKQSNSSSSTAAVLVNIENPSANMFCKICNVPVCGAANYKQHISGASHKKREKDSQHNLNQESPMAVDSDKVTPQSEEIVSPAAASIIETKNSDEVGDVEGKTVEQLREELSDVIFCPVDMDPVDIVRKLRYESTASQLTDKLETDLKL